MGNCPCGMRQNRCGPGGCPRRDGGTARQHNWRAFFFEPFQAPAYLLDMRRHGLSSKTHYISTSLVLVLAVLSNAEGPSIHSQSFHMGYGLANDPITPRDYVNDIWNLRAALKETNLPGKMVRDADNRLKEASDQLVPLWRQSKQNPADAVDVNANTAAIW